MQPSRVVMETPLLDDHLGFPEAVEDLAIEAFVPELAVERFTKAVLPWRSRFNVQALRAKP